MKNRRGKTRQTKAIMQPDVWTMSTGVSEGCRIMPTVEECLSCYPCRLLESISKPRLSMGSEFCIFNRFPRGHYLVWWVRVSLGVRVRVRVSTLLGSR